MRMISSASKSMEIRLGTDALFVDEAAGREAVETIGSGNRMWLVVHDQVGEAEAGGRRGLEPAVTPAGIEVEAFDRAVVDNRRTVHRHVHNAAPVAQHAQATEPRPKPHRRFHHVLDYG